MVPIALRIPVGIVLVAVVSVQAREGGFDDPGSLNPAIFQESNPDDGEIQDLIGEFRLRPVDLNRADAQELASIPGLRAGEARSIASERERSGPYRSWEDLRARQPLDDDAWEILRNFSVIRGRSWREARTDFSSPTSEGASQRVFLRMGEGRAEGGVGFSNSPRWLARGLSPEGTAVVGRDRSAGWDGGYLAVGAGDRGRFVAGDFRAGFLEGVWQERSDGFLPEAGKARPPTLSFDRSRHPTARLRGIGALWRGRSLASSLFFSQDESAARRPSVEFRPDGTESRSLRSIGQAANVRMAGSDLRWRPGGSQWLSLFGVWNEFSMRIPGPGPEAARWFAGGIKYGWMNPEGQGQMMVSRSEGFPGKGSKFLWHGWFSRTLETGTRLDCGFRSLGSGYQNLAGTLVSGPWNRRLILAAAQKIGDEWRTSAKYESLENDAESRDLWRWRCGWKPGRAWTLEAGFDRGQAFSNRRRSPGGAWTVSAVAGRRLSESFRDRLEFDYLAEQSPAQENAADWICDYSFRIRIKEKVGLRAGVEWRNVLDSNPEKSGEALRCGLELRPVGSWTIFFSWATDARAESDPEEPGVTLSTVRRWEARTVYRW